MQFPDAFKKVFISDGTVATTGGPQALTGGKIGFYGSKNNNAVTDPAANGNAMVYLAQGSFHNADKIGPFHGGYKESIKSKGIIPKYIQRFYKETARTSQNQVVTLGWDRTAGSTSSPDFECGKTYNLRIDLKGSPVLRYLTHNAYQTFDAYSGCCANDCSAGCTGDPVDPTVVLLQWADGINTDPIFKNFVKAVVYVKGTVNPVTSDTYVPVTDLAAIPAVVSGIELTTAYTDSTFNNCSFDPQDHYELEPIQIYASLVDETGEPCAIKPILTVTETQPARQAMGVGETVIRDLILDARYRQEPFQNDVRLRQVLDDVNLTSGINRDPANLYDKYSIVHVVPRNFNYSSTFDDDQYLLQIVVPAGTNMTTFTTFVNGMLTAAGNSVVMETL